MANEIKFKTVITTVRSGEKPLYRGVVQNKGTLYKSDITKSAAARVGMDQSVMDFNTDLFFNQLKEELKSGYRVEIEDLLSGGLAVKGTFASANAPWDATKNALTPYFYAKGGMKAALAETVAVNVTEGNRAQLKRVLDTVLKTEGVIARQANVTVYLSGANLLVNAAAEDEGVWLEDQDGIVVATASVTGSTSTTVDCVFATLPAVGSYKIAVATRGGLGSEFGVSIARKNVEVVAVA